MDPNNLVREAVCRNISDLRSASLSFDELFDGLLSLGRVAVIGGAARDWPRGRSPRDVDFVVDAPAAELAAYMKQYRSRANPFGGYEYHIRDSKAAHLPNKLDIWAVGNTWAYTAHRDSFSAPSLENLTRTTFFNIDAIVVQVAPDGFLDTDVCFAGFAQKTLDIVFEPNPFPRVCLVKALVQADKYGLTWSERLGDFVRRQADITWADIASLQKRFWGYEVVSRERAAKLLPDGFRFAGEP